MKFYAFLCVLISTSLLVTPAVALIGAHKESADVSPAEMQSAAETSAVTESTTDYDR